MAKKQTAERAVAQAIFQETQTVEVGGKTYEVAPPSIATLIKVSDLVSQMPDVNVNTEDFIGETLRVAKDSRIIGDIIATVILGAKRIRDFKVGVFGGKKTELSELSEALLYEKSPKELSELLADILVNRMDVGFFFRISTSLSAVRITKPTKS
jgi:hypothetical protein